MVRVTRTAKPLAYGVVAATDTHIGAAGAAHEIPFFGHGGAGKSKAQVVSSATLSDSPWFNPGGITAVWAEENTRASIYDALKRRESYGTSGTRISLRLFASEKETEHSCGTRNWLSDLQRTGVPMGGRMRATLPKLHILAQADPNSAALAKIEVIQLSIIKGDIQKSVETIWSNETGQKTVCTIWDLDTIDAPSIVYVRVLEHLSPRWSVDACKTRKCPEMATKWIQKERGPLQFGLHRVRSSRNHRPSQCLTGTKRTHFISPKGARSGNREVFANQISD